jgi:hypothetical protein
MGYQSKELALAAAGAATGGESRMGARGVYFFLITSLSHRERGKCLRSVHKGW